MACEPCTYPSCRRQHILGSFGSFGAYWRGGADLLMLWLGQQDGRNPSWLCSPHCLRGFHGSASTSLSLSHSLRSHYSVYLSLPSAALCLSVRLSVIPHVLHGFNPWILALTCVLISVLSQPFNVYSFLMESYFCSERFLASRVCTVLLSL